MPETVQTNLSTASSPVPSKPGPSSDTRTTGAETTPAKGGERGSESYRATSGGRVTWWMAVIGLSYLITYGFIFYLILRGPGSLRGFVSTFSGDAMVIRSVESGS